MDQEAKPRVEKMLGKIRDAQLGFCCGRGDNAFGLKLQLEGPSWGVGAELIMSNATPDQLGPKDLEGDQGDTFSIWSSDVRELMQIMVDGKINDVSRIKGLPVEVTFHDGALREWRVLKEVL